VDGLIAGLKYQGRLAHANTLLQAFGEPPAETAPDCLIPVPLHPQRLRERGFNQAAELARLLSRRCDTPWDPDSLVRVRAGRTQRGSRRGQRLHNMRGAFEWRGTRPCPARVALIDDVVTTGATARAAAACLKQAGATWVSVWAVARTPRRESPPA
jgi:ComF family protein